MEGSEGECVWDVLIEAIGACIVIRIGELQMGTQNDESIKFFNVEEEEENGHGKDKKKRSMEKKGDSSVRKSSWFESTLSSFKEDSYYILDMKESEKKALQDLKLRIESAIKSNEFLLEGLGANGNHDASE